MSVILPQIPTFEIYPQPYELVKVSDYHSCHTFQPRRMPKILIYLFPKNGQPKPFQSLSILLQRLNTKEKSM